MIKFGDSKKSLLQNNFSNKKIKKFKNENNRILFELEFLLEKSYTVTPFVSFVQNLTPEMIFMYGNLHIISNPRNVKICDYSIF